jgi:hypothetical protein
MNVLSMRTPPCLSQNAFWLIFGTDIASDLNDTASDDQRQTRCEPTLRLTVPNLNKQRAKLLLITVTFTVTLFLIKA